MTDPREVLDFWLGLTPVSWYAVDPAVDDTIRNRFAPAWEELRAGGHGDWLDGPSGSLAYLILADQFPRNMFRGDAGAFATDEKARSVARRAIEAGWDLRVPEPERQFFYLPFMHSENPEDQDRCCRLIDSRMPETGASNLLHARAHREVIRRFGRFPYRNVALGRTSTTAEEAFLAEGGYGSIVNSLKPAASH